MFFEKIKSFFSKPSRDSGKEKLKGIVRRIYHKKGYGFISSPDLDDTVFVHFNDTISRIRMGSKVNFFVHETEKGLRATEVETIK